MMKSHVPTNMVCRNKPARRIVSPPRPPRAARAPSPRQVATTAAVVVAFLNPRYSSPANAATPKACPTTNA
jgi:hypothetical protein